MLMTLLLMIALLIATALVLIWQVSILFRVDIREGKVQVGRGDVPKHFLHEARSVVRRHDLNRGHITAMRTRNGPRLRFSSNIPREARTSLRHAMPRR